MGEVVDLAERRLPGKAIGVPLGDVVELEHIGTVGPVRVSLVALPDAEPGWTYVALSNGVGSVSRGIFPSPGRPDGGAARIIARAVVRALTVVLPTQGRVEMAAYATDVMKLHDWFAHATDELAGDLAVPVPPCEPDGAA